MPTVPFAPSNARMMPERALIVADEAERRRQELEDLMEKALDEKEAIEKVDGKRDWLIKAVRTKMEAAKEERAKPDGVRDDARVATLERYEAQLQSVLESTVADLASIKKQIEILERELNECLKELEAANRVILTEHRLIPGVVPVTILYAKDKLTHFTGVRAMAVQAAEAQFAMKGVVAVERVIQPFWNGLAPFVEALDEAKLNTGGLGIILYKYPILDPARSEAFAAAFESLPLTGDSKKVAAEVRALVEGYSVARQALVDGDPKNAHKRLKELERAAVALKQIPSLWEAGNEPAEVKKRREAFTQKEKEEQERHQPELMQAEHKLWQSLQEPSDRELLVKAHLGEAEAVPEHPIFEKLKIEDERITYIDQLLERVGVPVGSTKLTAGLSERLKDAQALKTNKTSEQDLLENWKDDLIYLLDPTVHAKDPNVAQKIVERVKRLSLRKPTDEEIQLLVQSVSPGTPPADLMKELRHRISMYFGALKDKKSRGSVVLKDRDAIMDAIGNQLGDLIHGFNDLITGEMQKKQLAAKIDPTKLRPDARAIMGLIAAAEGITVVDPVKLAKAAEEERQAREFVEGFVASMERVEALKKERDLLQKDTVDREALVPEVASALEKHKALQATHDEIERARPLIIEYLLEREMPMGVKDETERKQFETNWPATHEGEVRVKRTQEETTRRALTAAEKALQLTLADAELKQLQAEIDKVENLAGALAHIDINQDALVADVAGRDAILKQIPKIDIDGKEHTGVSLVEAALAAGPGQPLKQVQVWLPKAIKELTLDAAYLHGLPEVALAAAYAMVEAEAGKARTAANWFQQNFAGRPEKSWYKWDGRDAVWKAELDQQVKNVRAELERILFDITVEHLHAVDVYLKAYTQHHPEMGRYKAAHIALKERVEVMKATLGSLDKKFAEAIPEKGYTGQELIGLTYKGLRQVVYSLTNDEPPEYAPSPEAFGLLIQSLERIKQDPATSVQLLAVLEGDLDRAIKCISHVKSVLPGQLTAGPEIDLAGKKAKLVSKSAKIVGFQTAEAEKRTAHEAAVQELARVEAETLADRLAIFDRETSAHINKVIDPKGVLTQQDEIKLSQDTAAAQKALGELDLKLKNLIDLSATHYTAWLTKRDALTTLTKQPTELEKVAVESVLKVEQTLFGIFEKQRANKKMNATQFSAWYQGLKAGGGDAFRALRNELVPGLNP